LRGRGGYFPVLQDFRASMFVEVNSDQFVTPLWEKARIPCSLLQGLMASEGRGWQPPLWLFPWKILHSRAEGFFTYSSAQFPGGSLG
jgi:hypothetical protein